MKNKLNILLLTLFLINVLIGFGQVTQDLRIGPNYSTNDSKLDYIFIYDGIPIFEHNEIRKIIKDSTTIDSIFIQKRIVSNCDQKPLYNAIIVIMTKDSINTALKYILAQTNNWILKNPMADLMINGKKTSWIKELKHRLSLITPDMILKIDLVEPDLKSKKCSNGLIKLTIK
jgi:hypothetical protein